MHYTYIPQQGLGYSHSVHSQYRDTRKILNSHIGSRRFTDKQLGCGSILEKGVYDGKCITVVPYRPNSCNSYYTTCHSKTISHE